MKIKKILKYFGIIVAVLIGGVLVAGQITYYSTPEPGPPPGKMYSINEGQIHMYCTGPENDELPTIIIISGAGTPSVLYFPLQERLSETTRTCSYDSAGIGWSKANDIPYTAKNLSNELSQLLESAQISSPIILAGHSLGGVVSLIYSAEHEEQVAGIAFIDSSHYNQFDYFGKEFRDASDKQLSDGASSLWLFELASNLGIISLMNLFDTSVSEIHEEEHKMVDSFQKENSPFPTMKSMITNLNLSFEQGKEAHYPRGNLPIISLSASGEISDEPIEIGGISSKEYREGFIALHKDLSELSTEGRHVVINGTNHIDIVNSEETANQILNFISQNNDPFPIDSKCDWFLVNQLEYQIPFPSQWYLKNFHEEYETLRTSINDEKWKDETYKTSKLNEYHESLKKKTIPELHNFEWEMLESGEKYFDDIMKKDPRCHEIMKTNYAGFNAFR